MKKFALIACIACLAASPAMAAMPHRNVVLQKEDFTKEARGENTQGVSEEDLVGCRCTSKVAYPEFIGKTLAVPAINAQIKAFAQKYEVTKKTEDACNGNEVNYEITRNDHKAITVLFTQTNFCGAYPNTYHYALNFDAKTGEALTFSALIAAEAIPQLEKACLKQYATSAQSPYSLAEAEKDETVQAQSSLTRDATDTPERKEGHKRNAILKSPGFTIFTTISAGTMRVASFPAVFRQPQYMLATAIW